MKKLIAIALVISVFSIAPVFGQETQEQPKKIEVKKGLFPSYKYDGKTTRISILIPHKLGRDQLEKIVLSINDEEATLLFKKSLSLGYAAMPFAGIGGSLIGWSVGGKIGGGEFNTTVFTSGCGILTVGLVLGITADRVMIRSVERYNQVLKEKWGISLQYSPKNRKFGLRLSY